MQSQRVTQVLFPRLSFSLSRTPLGICEIPLSHLVGNIVYPLELCTANLSAFDTPLAPIRLFADVALRPTSRPLLQVKLGSFSNLPSDEVLGEPLTSIVVVGKLVSEIDNYNLSQASMFSLPPLTVTCPVTDASEFQLPAPSQLPSTLLHVPQRIRGKRGKSGILLDDVMCFAKPSAPVFTPASGLVLEFYHDSEDGRALFACEASLLLGRILVKLDPSRIHGKPSE